MVHRWFSLRHENLGQVLEGPAVAEVVMKSPLLIVITIFMLATVGTLAAMNNACRSGPHAWCAPTSRMRHYAKTSALESWELHRTFAVAVLLPGAP